MGGESGDQGQAMTTQTLTGAEVERIMKMTLPELCEWCLKNGKKPEDVIAEVYPIIKSKL